MKKVNWGIIGCGDVTEVKSGPALRKIPDSRLVAVMRRSAAKAEDYARRHGVPKWYTEADQLIQDSDVHAIYIATPPDSHAEYTLKVARAGKPVYVEKPMALNTEQCEKMIQACQEANVPLWVAYYRRRLPTFMKVKEILDSKTIGDIQFVSIRLYETPREGDRNRANLPWRLIPEIAGGGYFVDMGAHQIDILDFLLGPISKVKGVAVNCSGYYQVEDTTSASFEFENGVVGNGIWCFTVNQTQRTDITEIVGTKGRILFASFDLEQPVILETESGKQEFRLPPPPHVQQPLLQTVVDELMGKGKCPSSGETARRTTWVIDQILHDYRHQHF